MVNQGLETRLSSELDSMLERGTLKHLQEIEGRQSAVVELEGYGEVVNLCSNNYLGLCDEPEVMDAIEAGVERYGAGTSSVRFICGTFTIHRELEEALAEFMGTEASVTYTSCWNANEGLFAPLLSEEDVLISDELNHASIIDGIRLCKARRAIYAHMEMDSLREALRAAEDARHRLVVTDGVFSMEGEIAPLPEIRELCDEHDAIMVIDDSHATGVLGETGHGTPEHYGMHGEIDIVTSTLGKALGGMAGGFTASSETVVEYLVQNSRTQLFTNALPPHSACGALAAVRHLEAHPELVAKLRRNTAYFRERLLEMGYRPIEGDTPIVPIIIGDTADAIALSRRLLDHGAFVIGFGFPVVPEGKARIRCQISAGHDTAHLDTALDALRKVGTELGIL
ncbi:MAG: glycine C-acetyltransferase [Candidatus Palauibacterales bacterium]|nr:glycine C-acetyltransferase [Candidatus Palauibacterales bacterium]MDP2583612.1 glycine C-acetyltransferase [Candidatus Palauibacterales bacterium]